MWFLWCAPWLQDAHELLCAILDSIHEDVRAAAKIVFLRLSSASASSGQAPQAESQAGRGKEEAEKFADTVCPSCVTFRFVAQTRTVYSNSWIALLAHLVLPCCTTLLSWLEEMLTVARNETHMLCIFHACWRDAAVQWSSLWSACSAVSLPKASWSTITSPSTSQMGQTSRSHLLCSSSLRTTSRYMWLTVNTCVQPIILTCFA